MADCLNFRGLNQVKIQRVQVGKDINHIRIVIENVYFVYDTQFNHSTAPDNALKHNGFRALFNRRFMIKLCIKHSKPFTIPIVSHGK